VAVQGQKLAYVTR